MKPINNHSFSASEKPFTIELDQPCTVHGYREGDKYASFYNPVPVKKGDVFKRVPHGILLNGKLVLRRARPLREMEPHVSWVAKRLRVAVFLERDQIYDQKNKKWTKRYGKPYWNAIDLRSYHIGCHEDLATAIKYLLQQCQATNLCAEEYRAKGKKVVRWRCLLKKEEIAEMEGKAKKTGFILDGVEVPPLPEKWVRGLEELRKKHEKGQ